MSDRGVCTSCGAMVEPGEYHPYPFCVWKKAGLDPWRTLRIIAGQVGITDPGVAPPKVWETHGEPSTSQASGVPNARRVAVGEGNQP